MILFWLIISVMMITALAFVAWPLLKRNASKPLIIGLLFFIPILSISLYLKLGDSQGLEKWQLAQKNKAMVAREAKKIKDPKRLIVKMQAVLKQKPNSSKGWYLLGRLYLSQGQTQNAVNAFAKANRLQPKQPQVMLQYAQALYYANQNQLTAKGQRILKSLLKLEGNNLIAYNFLAMDAYNRGSYRNAIRYWEQMLPFVSPQSQSGTVIMKAIHNAQEKLKAGQ